MGLAKVAVVADENVATYFRVAGVKNSYAARNSQDADDIIRNLANSKDIAIIVVTEPIAAMIPSTIETVSKRITPTVITIPGREGPRGERVTSIVDLVKRTIGVEIKI